MHNISRKRSPNHIHLEIKKTGGTYLLPHCTVGGINQVPLRAMFAIVRKSNDNKNDNGIAATTAATRAVVVVVVVAVAVAVAVAPAAAVVVAALMIVVVVAVAAAAVVVVMIIFVYVVVAVDVVAMRAIIVIAISNSNNIDQTHCSNDMTLWRGRLGSPKPTKIIEVRWLIRPDRGSTL